MNAFQVLALGACLLLAFGDRDTDDLVGNKTRTLAEEAVVDRDVLLTPKIVTQKEALGKLSKHLKTNRHRMMMQAFVYAMKYSDWKIYGITEEEMKATERERSNPSVKERIAYQAKNGIANEDNKEQWMMADDAEGAKTFRYVDWNRETAGADEFDGWIAYDPQTGQKYKVPNEDMTDKTKMEPAKNPEMRFQKIRFPDSEALKKFEHSKRFVQKGPIVWLIRLSSGVLDDLKTLGMSGIEAPDGRGVLPFKRDDCLVLTSDDQLKEEDYFFRYRYVFTH